MTENRKRRHGDRKDGYWLRDLDSMHRFAPYILRNRADCEACISETIDLTAIHQYLAEKNAGNVENRYTLFHVLSAAMLKTVVLRPAMNRFVSGRRIYQRNYLSLAFVAKRQFSDDGKEALLFLRFDDDFTLETVRDKISGEVNATRAGKSDNSTDVMDILVKMPRFLLRIVGKILWFLDHYGKMPYELIKEEPNYSTIFLSNLGSISLNAAYHHLNNWGTNSLFVVIGERKKRPFFDAEGNVEMKDSMKLSITLDERIADGYYYAKSIALLRYLLQNPQLLELPANTKVEHAFTLRRK